MIIHNVTQGSEAWEQIRKGKATASRFGDILTPKKLTLSASAKKYAAELVCERLEIETPEFLPTYWMQYGTEAEEYAVNEFRDILGLDVQRVGFVTPEEGSQYGCSPDGLVGEDGVIEVKCPKAETLVLYHDDGVLPAEHRLQVQGELWVTGRDYCHFWAWHPQLNPFHLVVERDDDVMDALDEVMPQFLSSVEELYAKVKSRPMPEGFQFADLSEDLV